MMRVRMGNCSLSWLVASSVIIAGTLSGQPQIQVSERNAFIGHQQPVFKLSFSPDGKYLASASFDRTVRIWEAGTGRLVHTLSGHTGPVFSLTYSPDGSMIASAGGDNTIRLWNCRNGNPVRSMNFEQRVLALAFHPILPHLAAGGESGVIEIWDYSNGNRIQKLNAHTGWISCLAYSPDGSGLISGSYDREVKIWNLNGDLLKTILPGNAEVNDVQFIDRGAKILAGSSGKLVKSYDVLTGNPIRTFEQASAGILALDANEDRDILVAALADGAFMMWSIETGAVLHNIPTGDETINDAVISPTDHIVATAGSDRKIRIWNVKPKENVPPSIAIVSPVKDTTDQKIITLTINVSDDVGVDRISVMHNNNVIVDETGAHQPADIQTRSFVIEPSRITRQNGGVSLTFSRDVELAPGSNEFKVIAYDKETSTINSRNVTYEIPYWMKGKRWAVVIGISEYTDPAITPLQYSHKDAQEFYDFITSTQGGGFKKENTRLLINKEATHQKIREAIHDFLRDAISEDLVYIFFSGHGASDPANPDNTFFLAYDTDMRTFASTSYPMWQIDDAIKRKQINAKRIFIFADACHSGGFGGDIAMRSLPSDNLVIKYLLELSNTQEGVGIFTASRIGELSRESSKWGGGHGVFTFRLLEGFKGAADVNGNGIVTIGEVVDYTSENVRRDTQSGQHPTERGDYDRNHPMSVLR